MAVYGFKENKTRSDLTIEQMILNSENACKTYTDQAKNDAKNYANTQATNALNSSKTYSNNLVSNTAASLRNDSTRYTDNAKTAAVNESKAYTNSVANTKQDSLAGGTVPDGTNLNNLYKSGYYWLTNNNYINVPYSENGYGFLEVMVPQPSDNMHILQRVTQTNGSFTPIAVFLRTWIGDGTGWSSWVKIWG